MKSFLLSGLLTTGLILLFFASVEKKMNAVADRLPDWFVFVLLGFFCVGYVLSLYWGVTGVIKAQRFLNVAGIFLSIMGLGFFYGLYKMESGAGKEKAGQFSYSLDAIEPLQRQALDSLLHQSGTDEKEISMVNYWSMAKNKASFSICIQNKNIIALQIKDKPLTNLTPLSYLKHINWLVLENCGIETIKTIHLPALERLYVSNNKLATLDGLENFPTLGWIKIDGNPLRDSISLKNASGKMLYIVN